MDYSDKIQTHIDALRHYLLAQAETNDPFVSQKDRNERISRMREYPVIFSRYLLREEVCLLRRYLA